MRPPSWLIPAAAVLAAGLLLAQGLRIRRDLAAPVDLSAADSVPSGACRDCHERRHETWHATFHRTMTQPAATAEVLGDFEDATHTYAGVTSRFSREGRRYFIETLDATDPGSGRRVLYEVAMTVGSRRIQQYVTRIGDRHFRLPLAWNVEEARWFHLNGGFLHPDGADFHNHTALWDANCIFCHNTGADPGYDPEAGLFDASVAEPGIACEACHGPGAEHVARRTDPVRGRILELTRDADPSIVSPERLDPARRTQLCGHCHGQRLPRPPERIREFVTTGDPYTAGDDLAAITSPVWIDTELEGVDFSLRFWRDGTPRLTAFEYQGLLQSPVHTEAGLTCTDCHSMHGGDPRGMIREEMRGPAACASCHAEITADPATHTRHDAAGPGSACTACHMPPVTYGVLDIHPTHRIRNPDPARAWRYDMPEACTLCHLDRPAAWAEESVTELWGKPAPDGGPSAEDDPPADFRDIAESVRSLLAGDVVQRVVALEALTAGPGAPGAGDTPWVIPFLLFAMEDNYPAVRHFAHRGLRRLLERAGTGTAGLPAAGLPVAGLPAFDAMDPPEARRIAVERARAWWSAQDKSGMTHPGPAVPLDAAFEPDAETVRRLAAGRDERIIAIGE